MSEKIIDHRIYEFLLRTTQDGLLIADTHNMLLHLNPAAAAMLGLTVEDSVDKSVNVLFRENLTLVRLFRDDTEMRLDVRLPRERLAHGIAQSLQTGERMVLLQDVTEKRSIEDRRGMLSKAIAHDLRNPIAGIGGFADLIERFGDVNTNQRKYLTRIKQTTAKLHDMVTSLVDLAWIEAGMPLKHLPIRLHELIMKATHELGDLAKKQSIIMAVSVQTPLPIVMGDPDRLYMVIYNLIHNALIYSEQESSIAIHAWGDEHEVYCSVGDRGIGILEHEKDLIFDRMYRSADKRVSQISGGGLGLTVARTIVRRHGGDLWVNSILDEGSTFMFVLPSVKL